MRTEKITYKMLRSVSHRENDSVEVTVLADPCDDFASVVAFAKARCTEALAAQITQIPAQDLARAMSTEAGRKIVADAVRAAKSCPRNPYVDKYPPADIPY